MTLQLLDVSTFPCIQGLIKEAAAAAHIADRINIDHTLSMLHGLVEGKIGQIYVDNIGLPKVVLIMIMGPTVVFSCRQCQVLFIYATPSARSPAAAAELLRIIEQAARAEDCKEITASSWCYKHSDTYPDISSLWLAAGYVEQDRTFVKILTPTQ